MSSPHETPAILALADNFSTEEQAEIARVAGVTVEHPSFRHFLGMARFYGLSPLLGEIWLLETDVFDRGSGQWTTQLRPAVGRDGFLKVVSRDSNIITPARGNVVCANDHFAFNDDGYEVKIEHSATISSGEAEGEGIDRAKAEAEARGPVLGAWAKLYFRDNRPPFFFYAPLSEYGKRGLVGQDGAEPAEDLLRAWVYTSAMNLKCAQSYVYRVGGGITGLVPADEIRGGAGTLAEASTVRSEGKVITDVEQIVNGLGVKKDTREKLLAALSRVNELSPFSWSTAKVSVMLEGSDQATAERVLAQVQDEIAKLEEAAEARA